MCASYCACLIDVAVEGEGQHAMDDDKQYAEEKRKKGVPPAVSKEGERPILVISEPTLPPDPVVIPHPPQVAIDLPPPTREPTMAPEVIVDPPPRVQGTRTIPRPDVAKPEPQPELPVPVEPVQPPDTSETSKEVKLAADREGHPVLGPPAEPRDVKVGILEKETLPVPLTPKPPLAVVSSHPFPAGTFFLLQV